MLKVKFNLNDYVSPASEISCYRDIPIEFRELVYKILRNKTKRKFAFRYRGPRNDTFMALFCRLENAKTFAVYYRDGFYA